MSFVSKIKKSNLMKPVKFVYKYLRYGEMPKFSKPAYFLNNSKGFETACFILAGYKKFTWEIIFKRIKTFCPENIDICIVSSGMYSEELKNFAEQNGWSYIAMKRNCVTLALNSAIQEFKNAKNIFKLDEDIFVTEGFFESLPCALNEAKKDYFPMFSAPLIPINGYGYRRILEKLNLAKDYEEKFEYPKVSAGIRMKVENDIDVAKFFWGKDGYVPQIDVLNRKIKEKSIQNVGGGYSVCPIRFSIGAIYFERKSLENVEYFPVKKGSCMGLDEVFLCNFATSESNVIVVSEQQVVGHLSFGKQNKEMEEYFKNHKELFEINDDEK